MSYLSSTRPQRLLVVEDEPLVALTVADQLTDLGYTVGPAFTIKEARPLAAVALAEMSSMARYYFSIVNSQPFGDTDGLELPDLTAVRDEAAGFARDLMRLNPRRQDWSGWSIRVTDEDRRTMLDLSFAEAA